MLLFVFIDFILKVGCVITGYS